MENKKNKNNFGKADMIGKTSDGKKIQIEVELKKNLSKKQIENLSKKQIERYSNKQIASKQVISMDDFYETIRKLLMPGFTEIKETKKPVFYGNQFSLKIPNNIALKSELDKDSLFEFVFNPNEEETVNNIKKSKFVIYLKDKEGDRNERKKEENTT